MSVFWILLRKDLAVEGRGREMLPSMAVFTLLLLALTGASGVRAEGAPAILWITVAVAAASGLGRGFLRETDQDQLAGLHLAAVDPAVLYLAKAAANFLVVAAVEVIAVGAVVVFFDAPAPPRAGPLAAVLLLGTAALVSLGTLLGGMLAAARMREALLPLLLLPLGAPAVMAASGATARLLTSGGSAAGEIRLLAAFTALFVAVSMLVFEHVVEE